MNIYFINLFQHKKLIPENNNKSTKNCKKMIIHYNSVIISEINAVFIHLILECDVEEDAGEFAEPDVTLNETMNITTCTRFEY